MQVLLSAGPVAIRLQQSGRVTRPRSELPKLKSSRSRPAMSEQDPWDSVLDVEEQCYSSGYKEGQAAAATDGILEDGRRAGFMKGYAIGMEAGFMEGTIRKINQIEKDGDRNTSQPLSRTIKRREELLDRCAAMPQKNDPAFDFPSEVNQMRTIYKQCGTGLEFLPKKMKEESSASQDW
jgi:hypothetical protein